MKSYIMLICYYDILGMEQACRLLRVGTVQSIILLYYILSLVP